MKDESYIRAIKILARADIQTGKRKVLESDLKRFIGEEDYETCEGISQALKESCTHEFVSKEYASQPYGTCMACGKTIFY